MIEMTINVHAIMFFQFEDKRIKRFVEEADLTGDFKFTEFTGDFKFTEFTEEWATIQASTHWVNTMFLSNNSMIPIDHMYEQSAL